jgi:hypothetical protein
MVPTDLGAAGDGKSAPLPLKRFKYRFKKARQAQVFTSILTNSAELQWRQDVDRLGLADHSDRHKPEVGVVPRLGAVGEALRIHADEGIE